MLTNESKIAMIGADAIGGITAAFIQQSGRELKSIFSMAISVTAAGNMVQRPV